VDGIATGESRRRVVVSAPSMFPMQAWSLTALEDARQRLRAEVWALELAPGSLAAQMLIAIADDPAGFKFVRVADGHGMTRSTLTSRWERSGLPKTVRLRDRARMHLLASLLQHPDMSATFAAVSLGEPCSQHLWRVLRRHDLKVEQLRSSTAPRTTLREWCAVLQARREGFAALPEPTVRRVPSSTTRVLRAEIVEVERRLAGLRAELRRSA
jgi:hypothetical protein